MTPTVGLTLDGFLSLIRLVREREETELTARVGRLPLSNPETGSRLMLTDLLTPSEFDAYDYFRRTISDARDFESQANYRYSLAAGMLLRSQSNRRLNLALRAVMNHLSAPPNYADALTMETLALDSTEPTPSEGVYPAEETDAVTAPP